MPVGALVTKEIAAVAIVAAAPATIWTPTAGTRFRLMGWKLSSTAAASLIFKEGAGSTALVPPVRTEITAAAGVSSEDRLPGDGVAGAAINSVLKLDVSVNSTITGLVWGYEDPS